MYNTACKHEELGPTERGIDDYLSRITTRRNTEK